MKISYDVSEMIEEIIIKQLENRNIIPCNKYMFETCTFCMLLKFPKNAQPKERGERTKISQRSYRAELPGF